MIGITERMTDWTVLTSLSLVLSLDIQAMQPKTVWKALRVMREGQE